MTSNDEISDIDRRSLLKMTGAAAVGSVAFSGVASANPHPPDEIRFCGCSQVCVDSEHSYRILYATETEDGWSCELRPAIDEPEESEPGCFTVDENEKIIGVLDGERNLLLNPNNCAQVAISRLGGYHELEDCEGCGGDCVSRVYGPNTSRPYTQESRHEYVVDVVSGSDDMKTITIRTRMCKPPEKWDDDPNGPPKHAGGRGRGRK